MLARGSLLPMASSRSSFARRTALRVGPRMFNGTAWPVQSSAALSFPYLGSVSSGPRNFRVIFDDEPVLANLEGNVAWPEPRRLLEDGSPLPRGMALAPQAAVEVEVNEASPWDPMGDLSFGTSTDEDFSGPCFSLELDMFSPAGGDVRNVPGSLALDLPAGSPQRASGLAQSGEAMEVLKDAIALCVQGVEPWMVEIDVMTVAGSRMFVDYCVDVPRGCDLEPEALASSLADAAGSIAQLAAAGVLRAA